LEQADESGKRLLYSLKDDLLGRRLRPFLLLLVVALVAAVAYAVLGGGSSTPTTPVAASAPAGASAAVGDVTVSQAPVNPTGRSRRPPTAPRSSTVGRARSVHPAAWREDGGLVDRLVDRLPHHELIHIGNLDVERRRSNSRTIQRNNAG